MNCSEYLVDFLIEHGVTDIFGYAGGYIVPFMDALYKRKNILCQTKSIVSHTMA